MKVVAIGKSPTVMMTSECSTQTWATSLCSERYEPPWPPLASEAHNMAVDPRQWVVGKSMTVNKAAPAEGWYTLNVQGRVDWILI